MTTSAPPKYDAGTRERLEQMLVWLKECAGWSEDNPGASSVRYDRYITALAAALAEIDRLQSPMCTMCQSDGKSTPAEIIRCRDCDFWTNYD